jgi:hypothetical protein
MLADATDESLNCCLNIIKAELGGNLTFLAELHIQKV